MARPRPLSPARARPHHRLPAAFAPPPASAAAPPAARPLRPPHTQARGDAQRRTKPRAGLGKGTKAEALQPSWRRQLRCAEKRNAPSQSFLPAPLTAHAAPQHIASLGLPHPRRQPRFASARAEATPRAAAPAPPAPEERKKDALLTKGALLFKLPGRRPLLPLARCPWRTPLLLRFSPFRRTGPPSGAAAAQAPAHRPAPSHGHQGPLHRRPGSAAAVAVPADGRLARWTRQQAPVDWVRRQPSAPRAAGTVRRPFGRPAPPEQPRAGSAAGGQGRSGAPAGGGATGPQVPTAPPSAAAA